MKILKQKAKGFSRRALSVFLTLVMFISVFAGTMAGVFVTLAGNPTSVAALNRSYVVQNIDLLPVSTTADNTRTTLKAGTNAKESYKHSSIIVNKDDSVDFHIDQDNWHNNTNSNGTHDAKTTSFVEVFTVSGQKINPAENPWLMVRWSGSGRTNGRIYFTITNNGKEYGAGGKNMSEGDAYNFTGDPTAFVDQALTGTHKPFSVPLSNIINNHDAGYHFSNQTQTDFNAGVLHDYTIDFYKYLCSQSAYKSYLPQGGDWLDSSKFYITIYMSACIIASEAGQPLTAGTNVKWEQFAIGREVLNRPASLLPRSVDYMNVLDTGGNDVTYGRVSNSVEGSVTFLNTSSSKSVKFKWNLRRYFNATELEALNLDAIFSGMSSSNIEMSIEFGGRTTTYIEDGAYNYRGNTPTIKQLLDDSEYVRQKNVVAMTGGGERLEATFDFHKHLMSVSAGLQGQDAYKNTVYDVYFPDDSLMYIGDIVLTVPKNAKITFNKLEFQVENEEIPATEENSVYPWASENAPNGLPPVGTPAYSTALNGASGISYDWATDASKAPLVKTKVDLLSMKTYSMHDWTDTVIDQATDTTDVTYTRKSDGSSTYSSNGQSDYTYFKLMRWGYSKESSKWNRNYYTYLDVFDEEYDPTTTSQTAIDRHNNIEKNYLTKYLYYSYEIEDTNTSDNVQASAGLYFHFANSRRDKYTKKGQSESQVYHSSQYSHQYYLDHSGIGLNECSSMFYLGHTGDEYRYGAEAIVTTKPTRTGVIDLSSLWVNGVSNDPNNNIKNNQYLLLEALRVYLGPNTKLTFNYLFVGSESLKESARGQIANEGGDAVPWAVSKKDFDQWTDPDSSSKKFTYANKLDMLEDVESRAIVNGKTGYPGGTLNSDGSVTLTVTDTSSFSDGYLKMAGFGFDHVWRVNVAGSGDKAAMRYLNYSVSAIPGMRWSVMFCEHATSNDSQQNAIMTWCDSDAYYNEPSSGYDIYTSAPAGKSYMRYLAAGNFTEGGDSVEYEDYWDGDHNDSWRLYSIPGSQSGCIDLRQAKSNFDWSNIVSIYLVAYRDPRLVLDTNESPSVTFNYLYLTSTPVSVNEGKDPSGKPAVTPGTIYDWGETKVSAPKVSAPVGSDGKVLKYADGTEYPQKIDFAAGGPYSEHWTSSAFVNYYAGGTVNHIKGIKDNGTLVKTENDSGTGSYSIDSFNQLNIQSSGHYRLEFKIPKNFDLTTYPDLNFDIVATAPFKIAMDLKDSKGNNKWVNFPSTSGTGFTYDTAADRVKAGSYKFSVSLNSLVGSSLTAKDSVYFNTLVIVFNSGNIKNAKMTMKMHNFKKDASVDLKNYPYLYYSYRFVNNSTNEVVTDPPRVGIAIFESNNNYYFRNMAGWDSASDASSMNTSVAYKDGYNWGYGKPSFVRLNDKYSDGQGLRREAYYTYGSETGCIDLRQYFTDHDESVTLNAIRFYVSSHYFDTSNYTFIVDYLFLGGKSSTTTTLSTSGYVPLEDSLTPSDFRKKIVEPGTTPGSSTNVSVEINLDETPYLFYSAKLADGTTGTFGLKTNVTADGSTYFHRDASLTNGKLISSGDNPASTHYMLQSETGCIDVRQWYRDHGYTGNILKISQLKIYGTTIKFNYLFFAAKADKTIDLIPEKAAGRLENGLPTRTWVNPLAKENDVGVKLNSAREVISREHPLYDVDKDPDKDSTYDPYSPVPENGKEYPTTEVTYKGDVTNDTYNDLWVKNSEWSQVYLRYGNIISMAGSDTFKYSTTGNDQMSGLMIDLNETPYLHFSFEQPDTSRMAFVLQSKNPTASQELAGKTANEVRPWLSGYAPTSPAGQLITITSGSAAISYYKDIDMNLTPITSVSGNQSGVIDLRSWYTVTNGYSNVISLDSVRFYTQAATQDHPKGTDLKINHLYLSSSASAAYSVTFHTNKNDGNDQSYTQYVLKNANKQLVDDTAVKSFKDRNGYTFVGWYTDAACTDYFDINGTPLNGNLHLYARWIENAKVNIHKNDSEINLLTYMKADTKPETSGTGEIVFDDESLTLNNTGEKPFTVTFDAEVFYDIKRLRSLFVGFDIDKTNGGYNAAGVYTGFDIVLNAQSINPVNYSLVGDAFSLDFLTDNGLLTAAPYDRECVMYTYLGVRDELPTAENTGNVFEIDSITITVPVGVSSEIRYIKSANEMALQGNLDTSAPLSTTAVFDLLDNSKQDPSFVQTHGDVVYDQLDSKSLTFDGSHAFTQAAIHGITDGYAHLGGLYNYTIDMTSERRTLYMSVDQPEDSNFTFAIYASFDGIVEGDTGTQTDLVFDVHTPKSVSVFSAKTNTLEEKDYDSDATAFIPANELYFQGDKVIKIDLFEWYKDALSPYRSNNTIYRVKILGIRFFTDDRSTDTTVNYMFIGGAEDANSAAKFGCFMEYPYKYGHKDHGSDYSNYRYEYGTTHKRGETLYSSVEDLKNIPAGEAIYNDPTKEFLGWVFSDIAIGAGYTEAQLKDHLVWWNPNATNGNMYSTDNKGGSWSLTEVTGFVQNQKSVFYNFSTHNGNTQVITPVFASTVYQPTVKAAVVGSGSVSVISGTTTAVSGQSNTWTVPFGSSVALRATGSNFLGWYDDDVLVAKTADYYLYVTQDVNVEARFGTATQSDTELEYMPQNGRTIVWLQSESGTAGTDFYLKSVSGGDVRYYETGNPSKVIGHLMKSNIADTSGTKQIACYWNLQDSQVLRATAPSGYHWEHLLSDGSKVRVSESTVYEFIASTNIRLVAVANSTQSVYNGSIIIDEVAFDDNRVDPLLRINGQILPGEGEEVVSCGMVFTDYKGHAELPHYNCDASQAVTAKAWNSSTGQFVVEFSIEDSPEYVIRGFAIIRKEGTSEYEIRYSDTVTTIF